MSESSSWGKAFRHARDTEAEGAQYFEGFFKKAKIVAEDSTPTIQNIVTSAEFMGSDDYVKGDIARGTSTEETDDTERGGFCQPAGLAKFFASTKCSGHGGILGNNDVSAQVMEQASAAVSDIADSTERESSATRQICRAWLKNNFLQLGQPCKNASCERRHVIESRSIGSLYKDYSFKGLSAVQRASIISQVQSSAAIVPDNDNGPSDITAELTTAADCAPVTTRGSEDMSTGESSRTGYLSVEKKETPNMGGLQGRKSSYIVTNSIVDVENIPDVLRTSPSTILESVSKKSRLYALYDDIGNIREPCESSLKSLIGRCSAPWMPVHRRITY